MALDTPRILRGSALAARVARAPAEVDERQLGLGSCAPPGRIVELCAAPDAAQTSAAVMVLREAQAEGDPVAWIAPRESGLYPPDLAEAGLDLDALVVVHVPPDAPHAIARAGELVLRTGAFGAVVLDLSEPSQSAPSTLGSSAWQGRLLGLAREHACRVIVLSPHARTRASLGPLVSLRFDVRRERVSEGCFRVEARVIKDKLGAATASSTPATGPLGAR